MPTPDLLETAIAEARATYPGITSVSDADARAYLLAKVAARGGSLSALRTAELFLACGCAKRDPVAIAHFERETFEEIELAHRRFSDLGITLDDVKQRMREKLFVGDAPTIASYAGTGALRGWVRAAVLNLLLNIAQRETREKATDAPLFEIVIGAAPDAEATYVKLACKEEFEAAFAFAIGKIDDREKALLRHAHVDGRNVDEIGAIYGVHRATAARWVGAARDRLVELTREDLVRRLGVSETEAQSIIGAALSGVGSILLARLGAR